jgi:hypothetical protein
MRACAQRAEPKLAPLACLGDLLQNCVLGEHDPFVLLAEITQVQALCIPGSLSLSVKAVVLLRVFLRI